MSFWQWVIIVITVLTCVGWLALAHQGWRLYVETWEEACRRSGIDPDELRGKKP